MELSNEIRQAARDLGQALNEDPTVQAFLDACRAVEQDTELFQKENEIQQRYEALAKRQQKGEVLAPHEVNQFYKLREQVVYHPLIVRREEAAKELKAAFEQVGSAISSILTVDYTALAG